MRTSVVPSIRLCTHITGGSVAEGVRALDWLPGGPGFESRCGNLIIRFGTFGNSVYPALPVSFGGDTKSRWSLLSGVYARGSKRSHQSALEMCNFSWNPPVLKSATIQRKTLPKTKHGRREHKLLELIFIKHIIAVPFRLIWRLCYCVYNDWT